MYYPYFLTYILTGLVIGLLIFVWALKNGQFSDQQRARFLPLEEESRVVVEAGNKGRYEVYVLFLLAVVGIVSSFAIIAYALITQ